ncbi:S-layer homology domain-containing protein [Kovacikia minuta CCNUW1]|uniref:S-layer homology domain-containing protein n=1 Tax=Kovacikia minuta TaxID=2931930 RepID=UPI001CCB4836|nr:S-layer homology domain-containing protein [Kovacikia minuta]UBF27691.1 S-layer homology domain-containing protein [Kovacikia minuta CCNUW1]
MVSIHRSPISLCLLTCLLLPLAGCANSSWGEGLQKSLQADDPNKLKTTVLPSPTTTAAPDQISPQTAQLPGDFPDAIPRYPNAVLQEVVPSTTPLPGTPANSQDVATRWVSQDSSDRILSFYRQQFQTEGWQILENPDTPTRSTPLTAQQGDLRVAIALQSAADSPASTAAQPGSAEQGTPFEIRYTRSNQNRQTAAPSASPSPAKGGLTQISPFSSSTVIGASGTTDPSQNQLASGPTTFSDLDKTPKELRQYVQDLARLGVLTPAPVKAKGKQTQSSSLFAPNKIITRREYARWLVSANNLLYADKPTRQVRLAVESSQPVFRDVARSDPDFAAIQGLAEAGVIPSPLSGDITTVKFRPNAPLRREDLLLWKVPMDTRQSLPTATIEGVKQTWGFQDVAKIDPKALRAVLQDYQNGDLSNIRRAFGYTILFQPKKPVTRAEAAATLWYFGFQGEGQSAQEEGKGEG